MRITFITAGAAGMYCGSCLRDNTLVTALRALGHDAHLVPTYTPIRTDEVDVSEGRVYYGGINVYLQDRSRLFRYTPRAIDWLFDRPWLLRLASKAARNVDYADLAGLTISMLAGRDGRQRKELAKLVNSIGREEHPDVVILTNALLSGLVPPLADALRVPVYVTLQGDDIFLQALPERARADCLAAIRRNDRAVTGYLATSHAYADAMATYLGLERAKIAVVYPGIHVDQFATSNGTTRPPTIGYFGRICPEKGFHNAVSAFLHLRQGNEQARIWFRAAGWLGDNNRAFFEKQVDRITAAGLAPDFEYVGSPNLAGKRAFYQSVDVFTLPTDYAEPKGLSVLEAWASGVPVVQPRHGSFPELIQATGGGVLYTPGDTAELARHLQELLADAPRRTALGTAGRNGVRSQFTARRMAEQTLDVIAAGGRTHAV